MPHTWEEIRRSIERLEDVDLERSQLEAQMRAAGAWQERLVLRARPILEILGGVAVGLQTAVMVLIFNYLLFVWILHVNFDH